MNPRIWSKYITLEQTGGDGGSGGRANVQEIPVPGPSDADLDTLAGDDDEGETEGSKEKPQRDEGGEEGESEGEKPRKKTPPQRQEGDFDIDEGDEGDEEGTRRGKAKESEDEEEEVEESAEGEVKPASYKALKEKYPNIFKEFPELRKSLGEHQRFRSLFTNVDEALETIENAENFIKVSDQLMGGDFEGLIEEMENGERGSFDGLAPKILPAIQKHNKDLYFKITDPVISQFLHAAFQRAQASGDEKLKNSTYWLNAFFTGNKEFPKAAGTPQGEDPRDKEFNERVKTFETQKASEAQSAVWDGIKAQLAHRIERALDPDGKKLKGKDTTKKALISALIGDIDADVASDQIHMTKVNRLWQQARRSSYSQQHLSRIISAYLDRANVVLPKLAKKVREENGLEEPARRGGGREENEEQAPRPRTQIPARLTGGREAPPRSIRATNPRNIDWRATSDEDVLAGRARLKPRR